MKAKIDTITLTIGERQLTFTMEEAEAVRALLNEKLGYKPPTHTIERIIEKPVRVWPQLREGWSVPESPSWKPEITCDVSPQTAEVFTEATRRWPSCAPLTRPRL